MADGDPPGKWARQDPIPLNSSAQKMLWLHDDTFLVATDRSVVLVDAQPPEAVAVRTWQRQSKLQAIAAHPNPQLAAVAACTGQQHQVFLIDTTVEPGAVRENSAGVVAVIDVEREPLDILCVDEDHIAILDKGGSLSLRSWQGDEEEPVEPVEATQPLALSCRTGSRGSMCFASSPTEFGECATAPGTGAPVLVTVGVCGWVRLWDASNLRLLSTLWTTHGATCDGNGDFPCVCPLPHGLLALGTGAGGVVLLRQPRDLARAAALEVELATDKHAPSPIRRVRPEPTPGQACIAKAAPVAAQWGSIGTVQEVVSYCTLGLHPFRVRADDQRPLLMATGCAADFGPNLIDVGRLRPFRGFDGPEPADWAAVAASEAWTVWGLSGNCRGALAKPCQTVKPGEALESLTNWTWRSRQGDSGVVVGVGDTGLLSVWRPPEPFRPRSAAQEGPAAEVPDEPLIGVNFRPWHGCQRWARRRAVVTWRMAARPPRRFRARQ